MNKALFLLAVVALLPFAFAAKECIKSDFSDQRFKNVTWQGTGERVAFGERYLDSCSGAAQVKEYFCFNAFLQSVNVQCPAGLYCAQGACGQAFEITKASYESKVASVETNYPAKCFVSNAVIAQPVESPSVFELSASGDGLKHSRVKTFSGAQVFFLCSLGEGYQLARSTVIVREPAPVIPAGCDSAIAPCLEGAPASPPQPVSEAVVADYGLPFTLAFLLFALFTYYWLTMPERRRK